MVTVTFPPQQAKCLCLGNVLEMIIKLFIGDDAFEVSGISDQPSNQVPISDDDGVDKTPLSVYPDTSEMCDVTIQILETLDLTRQ